ncbi:ABC transporter ATP-binding protein [Bacillus sp. Cs-700]|uniref:ABC transporter ATP-binding protein n=1 Tax=Bacillus sp. Cs-700 TaxID=2589818 RepID=UPI00140CC8AB|nr:ABC transporter ATP-binding protein [Bacillus sp. Cs-700]
MNPSNFIKLKIVLKQYFSMKDFVRTVHMLKPFVLKHKRAYFILFGLMLVDIALTITFAWFFGNITDAAIQSNFDKIRWLVPLGAGLILISIVASFLDIYFETAATNAVKRDVKNHLFHHILRLPPSSASNIHSGELLSHFSNDVHNIDGVIGYNLINLIRLPLIYLAVFVFLVQLNWTLSLISILIAPAALIGGVVFGLLLRKNGRKIHHLVGKISTLQNETFHGFQVIRAFTLEKSIYSKYKKKNEDLYGLEVENAKLQGWYYAGGQLVSSLSFMLSLCIGAYYVSTSVMTVGALIMFINLVNHLVYPLTGLAGQWAGFQRSISALERVFNVLDQPVDTDQLSGPSSHRKDLVSSIQFKNITFQYDDHKRIFQDLSLTIPAGKVVALVGPSGAGKTTLFNLLQGFYQPQSGEIRIDEQTISGCSLSELRSMIAHVPQETFLFGGSIQDNLQMARPGISDIEMSRAARHACIHEFICSLPDGYRTEIGERGVKLSGGQKQRLSIARAILKNSPILLLDEATSALDNETEHFVKEALDQLMEGKTTIVIAHRLSTVQNADLIIVMDEGRIVQSGTHEQLLRNSPLYQKLNGQHFSEEKTAIS